MLLELILLKTNYMILPALAIGLGASALQGIMGGIQAISANKKAKQLEGQLREKAMASPVKEADKQIELLYNENLRRYQASPYQTAKFVMGKNLADRSMATGLQALGKRNMALAGVNILNAQQQDNINKLFAQSEQDKRQDLQSLSAATRMKAQDDMTRFDINQMTPYNRQFGLLQMEANAANSRVDAGLQQLGNALGNAAMVGMMAPGKKKLPISTAGGYVEPIVETPRVLGNMSAPTSFTGRPLSFQIQDPVYGMSEMPRNPTNLGKKLTLKSLWGKKSK